MNTLKRSFSLGIHQRVQIFLTYILTAEVIAIINALTDTTDTLFGDLINDEISIFADTINGEII